MAATDDGAAPRTSGWAVLRNPNFAVYLSTAICSNAGSFMQAITVPAVLHQLTGSNAWVGAGAFAWMVPSLLVMPLSGMVTDRFDRRIVLMWSTVVQMAASAGLWTLAATGALSPARILSLVVIGGLGAGFQYSAAQSLAAVILPPEQLLAGVRMSSVGFTAARALGPAVAGVALQRWGAASAFGINTVSFSVFFLGLAVIRTRPVARPAAQRLREQLRGGLDYVARRPGLRLVVITALVSAFFGQSMVQLAAGLAAEEFDTGGGGLGGLVAIYGVGSTGAAFFLVARGDRHRRSRTALAGVTLFTIGVTVAVATRLLYVGLAGFLVAGIAHSLVGISLNTAMQAQVDEEYRGRALSTFLMALLAGMPFGALIGGFLGDVLGLRPTLLLYATALGLYLAVVVTRFDRLGALDAHRPAHQVASPSTHGSAPDATAPATG